MENHTKCLWQEQSLSRSKECHMCDHDIDERKLSMMNPGHSTGKVWWPFHLMQLSSILHVIFIMINKTNSQSIADGLYLIPTAIIFAATV